MDIMLFTHCNSASVILVQEFMKFTVDLGDLIGFYLILTSIVDKGEMRFMIAGLGWATTEHNPLYIPL